MLPPLNPPPLRTIPLHPLHSGNPLEDLASTLHSARKSFYWVCAEVSSRSNEKDHPISSTWMFMAASVDVELKHEWWETLSTYHKCLHKESWLTCEKTRIIISNLAVSASAVATSQPTQVTCKSSRKTRLVGSANGEWERNKIHVEQHADFVDF